MKVCILGLGYIGFPTACLVAQAGHKVVGVDTNRLVVDKLSNGMLHIVSERGLPELAEAAFNQGRLRVAPQAEPADVFIIAVPTPFKKAPVMEPGVGPAEEGVCPQADLSYVEAAVRSIARLVAPGNLVVLESTVPPGTTENVVRRGLERKGVDVSGVYFAHAPERVLSGNIIEELTHNDRVIGGLSSEAGQLAASFYRTFVRGQVIVTTAMTAELVKLMENTFRDVNIALANEFAGVCEHLGVDAWEAIELANRHPRVKFLKPGPGVGGHCIAVDPYFVIEAAPELTPLIRTARQVNADRPHHVVELLRALKGEKTVRTVALLGAAYKADVGDERESPALEVAKLLTADGLVVRVHDPYVERFAGPLAEVLSGSDAVLLMTDHRDYRNLQPEYVAGLVANRLLLDTRGCLDADAWRAAGFRVLRLGGALKDEVAVDA